MRRGSYYSGIFLGLLATLLIAGTVNAHDGYIDVHVHLQGTSAGGLFSNQSTFKRPAPPSARRPYLPGLSNRLRPKRNQTKHQSMLASLDENLDIAARNLIKKMDQHNVQQALVVVLPGKRSNEGEYQSMRDTVAKYPGRLKLMAGGAVLSYQLLNIPPQDVSDTDRFFFHKLTSQIIKEGAVGFGEMIAYRLAISEDHPFQSTPADHPLFLLLSDIAARYDVPIDIHMEAIVEKRRMPDNLRYASLKNPQYLEPTIPAFERLLAHNPKTRIVWQHIGWDNTGDMTTALVDRLLTAHPNLYIALQVEKRMHQIGHGPLLTEGPLMPNRLVNEKGFILKEWMALIKKHQDRIVIGSDEYFSPAESEHPDQSFAETWSLPNYLSPDIRKKIGYENPKRIYRLE